MSPPFSWSSWLAPLTSITHLSIETLLLTLLPIMLYGALTRRVAVWLRAAVLTALVGLGCAAVFLHPDYAWRLASTSIGLSYYLLMVLCVYALQPTWRSRGIGRDVLLISMLGAFVVFPAFVFRRVDSVTMLGVGWNIMLASYSYCTDAGSERSRPPLKSALFFLMVDPSLVYPQRAHPAPTHARRGLGRVALGVLSIVFGHTLVAPATLGFMEGVSGMVEAGALATLVKLVLLGAAAAFSLYFVRAGFADAQLGLLSMLGIACRESFLRPYLARSPLEFWRRWNLWVGEWARRYVFVPVSFSLRRKQRSWAVAWTRSSALGVTFLVMGAMHDVVLFAAQGQVTFPYLTMFMFSALAALLWELARSLASRVLGRRRVSSAWAGTCQRLMFAGYVVLMMRTLGAI
jgi:D-alanyl-lipoteichoic acid acyltransferase DltB (MBOAT superfamily)